MRSCVTLHRFAVCAPQLKRCLNMFPTLLLIFIIVFSTLAIRIAKSLKKESNIINEFNLPNYLIFLIMLYPLSPIILYIIGSSILYSTVDNLTLVVTTLAALACYLPGLIVAKRCLLKIDRAGTDRVRNAQNVITQAYMTAIGGIVYIIIVFSFVLIGTKID